MIIEIMVKIARKNKLVKAGLTSLDTNRIRDILRVIEPLLSTGERLLDIGSGVGNLAKVLIEKGYAVTTCDIKNISLFEEIQPIIIKDKLPFEDKSFTTSMLITVLHHTKNPKEILKEAKRVSDRIIIMEDTYKTTVQRFLTLFMDSLVNLEFVGHPHTNKSEEEWEETFKDLGLVVLNKSSHHFWKFFTSTTYLLGTEI